MTLSRRRTSWTLILLCCSMAGSAQAQDPADPWAVVDTLEAVDQTITTTVGKGDLAIGRGRQRNVQGWVRPDKRKARKKTEQ